MGLKTPGRVGYVLRGSTLAAPPTRLRQPCVRPPGARRMRCRRPPARAYSCNNQYMYI